MSKPIDKDAKTVKKKLPKAGEKPKLLRSATRVDYNKTISEIQQHLVRAGAKKIVFDYDEAELPCVLTFSYPGVNGFIVFSLPLRFQGISKILDKQKSQKFTGDLQPINTAWRIMKEWILSQLAFVEAEIAELPEVFLPYAVTKNGNRLYEEIKSLDVKNQPFLISN